eukprot:965120-Pyramimonas_sp.AAC.1
MFYRSLSEDCIYLRAKRVLTYSPVTPTKRITKATYSTPSATPPPARGRHRHASPAKQSAEHRKVMRHIVL